MDRLEHCALCRLVHTEALKANLAGSSRAESAGCLLSLLNFGAGISPIGSRRQNGGAGPVSESTFRKRTD